MCAIFYDDNPNEIHIGYWVGKHHRGRNIAQQSVQELMKDIRAVKPKCFFEAAIAPDNIASIKTVSKLGFKSNGTDMDTKQRHFILK